MLRVDIIAPDISKFGRDDSYIVVEINASPSFVIHISPFERKPRDPTAAFAVSVIECFQREYAKQ